MTKQKPWPKNGRALSNALRRLAPTLRAVGVDVAFDREPDQKRRRIIRLTQGTPQASTPPSGDATAEDTTSESDERVQEIF